VSQGGVDDFDKSASFRGTATPRRSTSSLEPYDAQRSYWQTTTANRNRKCLRCRGVLCAARRCRVGARTPALFSEPRAAVARAGSICRVSNCFLDHRNIGAHHLVTAASGTPLRFGVAHFVVDLGRWVCYILMHAVTANLRNSRRVLDSVSISWGSSYGPRDMAQLAKPPVGVLTIGSSDRECRLR
jgi:hypothetical protein